MKIDNAIKTEIERQWARNGSRGPSVFLTDEEAIEQCPRDLTVKAIKGFAIVWFLPFRRGSGIIEIPDRHKDESAEAIVIHDNGRNALDPGVKVCVSRHDGTYFNCKGRDGREHRVCRVNGNSIVLVDTAFCLESV